MKDNMICFPGEEMRFDPNSNANLLRNFKSVIV